MLIEQIKLKDFRNYSEIDVNFSNSINILIGKNAQGKTNLIEAIFLLVLTKSFRSVKNKDLVKWDSKFAIIESQIQKKDGEKVKLELVVTNERDKSQKQGKIDGVKTNVINFISQLNAVIFEPEDLNMISHEPALRRQYMDMTNAQISSPYVVALAKYNKVIKIRNKLLYNIRENLAVIDELTYWDKQILDFGAEIVFHRRQLVDYYNKIISKIYNDIANDGKKLRIKYETRIKSTDKETIRDELREMFDLSKLDDITQARTTSGPHRDDISFILDKHNVKDCGSRGEFRSIVLAMKLAEIKYIKEYTGNHPVLLLDDVFSELDNDRRKFLLEVVREQQTILTTTDISLLDEFDKKELNIIEIEEGKKKS